MTPAAFDAIASLVQARAGIVLTPDKDYMLKARLAPITEKLGLAGLEDLARRISGAQAEDLKRQVVEALTTNETSFFRDGAPFEHLKAELVRLAAARPGGEIRLWSAACSTGQEAYSVAMLTDGIPGLSLSILGTDLASHVVERAREGLYSQFEVQRGLPAAMLVKYFRKEGQMWRISDKIRARCRFETGNLLAPFTHLPCFDVILCRNVLYYFAPPTRLSIVSRMLERLAPGGLLLLGSTESLPGPGLALAEVPGARGIYRRT
ncbi:MAG: chemotaxis protein CheR [Acetobacteraceae bacterium]|nr:chemotaxis protein CheR [Acetobacteraceae bacterium]MDW8399489.1 CheR family methyltransferase [Acetobacteraceae bacterium]